MQAKVVGIEQTDKGGVRVHFAGENGKSFNKLALEGSVKEAALRLNAGDDAEFNVGNRGWDLTFIRALGQQTPAAHGPSDGAPTRSSPDSEKSLEMFCMGVVGRIGGAGVIQQPQEIPLWLQAAKDAWETIIQGKAPRMVDTPIPGAKYTSSEPPAPSEGDYYGH